MKITTHLFSLLLSALMLPMLAAAETELELLAELPSCSLKCFIASLSVTTCSSSNTTCMCADTNLLNVVTDCTLANCTIIEALSAKNITSVMCDAPIRNKAGIFRATSNSLGIITGAFVVARFIYRLFITHTPIGGDDWVALIAVIVGIPSSIINIHGLAANGLGQDIWKLPPEEVYQFIKFLYIIELNYFADIALLKLTLLFFYLRIFPAQGVRRLLWATIIFCIVWGITFIFVGVFQCKPISYYWTNWDGLHEGSCMNINALGWANAAISIVIDLWMLVIPLWQLRKLKLHWKKKIGVSMMFIVGTFVTVVSILRLSSLLHFANSQNPTWDNYEVINWSTIEINVGIICACMPSLRLLLVHFFPKIMGSTGAGYYHNSYGNSNNAGNSRGIRPSRGANSRNQRSIQLVSTTSGHHGKGTASTTVTTINARDEEDDIGNLPGQDRHRRNHLNGASTASNGATTPTGSPPIGTMRHGHSDSVGGSPVNPGSVGGIMYSKSYAVEYNTDYNDEARLVHERDQRLHSISKSDLKSKSSRGSESSL